MKALQTIALWYFYDQISPFFLMKIINFSICKTRKSQKKYNDRYFALRIFLSLQRLFLQAANDDNSDANQVCVM